MLLERLPARVEFAGSADELEHPVKRRIEAAGHVRRDEYDWQQVLVVNGLLPLGLEDVDELDKRNELAVVAGHPQHEERVKVTLVGHWQFESYRHRVLAVAVAHVGHIVAAERCLQGLCNAGLGNAEQCRLVAIDSNDIAATGGLDTVVDVDDVGRVGEQASQPRRQLLLPGVVGSINFGHQRRLYRRAGWYLDDLHGTAMAFADFVECRSRRAGDLVALALARGLVDEVDLDVADVRSLAQVVLADQAIEIDRRRGSRIDLVIGDLGDVANVGRHLGQHRRSLFDGGALRHVQHDLELRLVVERQHLHDHRIEADEADRKQDGNDDARAEPAARAPTFPAAQERADKPAEQAVEPGRSPVLLVFVVNTPEQFVARPRRHHERNEQREQHADARVDRDRAHVRAHQARDERHRQQRRDHRERREDRRPADLVDGRRDRLEQRLFAHRHMPVDVLDHDDGIVDEDADREDQGEQRHAVDREAPRPRRKQRQRECDDHGTAHNNRLAPAQGEENQDDHGNCCEGELLDQLLCFVVGRLAVVAGYRVLDSVGNHDVAQCLHSFDHLLRHTRGVGARFLGDRNRHRRTVAETDKLLGLIGARPDLGDILEINGFAVDDADNDFGDVAGARKKRARGNGDTAVIGDDRAGVRYDIAEL